MRKLNLRSRNAGITAAFAVTLLFGIAIERFVLSALLPVPKAEEAEPEEAESRMAIAVAHSRTSADQMRIDRLAQSLQRRREIDDIRQLGLLPASILLDSVVLHCENFS